MQFFLYKKRKLSLRIDYFPFHSWFTTSQKKFYKFFVVVLIIPVYGNQYFSLPFSSCSLNSNFNIQNLNSVRRMQMIYFDPNKRIRSTSSCRVKSTLRSTSGCALHSGMGSACLRAGESWLSTPSEARCISSPRFWFARRIWNQRKWGSYSFYYVLLWENQKSPIIFRPY